MTATTINGASLDYTDAGDGPTLVWGHGLTTSRAGEDLGNYFDWPRQLERIRVVRYDARGHGKSGAAGGPEAYTWKSLGHDMVALAESLSLSGYVAGGMSMGCSSALYAGLEAPDDIAALVLATPPTAWESRVAQASVYVTLAEVVRTQGSAVFADLMAEQGQAMMPPFLLERYNELAKTMAGQLAAMDSEALANVLTGASLANLPDRNVIKAIELPTLILAWEGDKAHPLSTAETLAELIPDSRLIVAKSLDDLASWPDTIAGFVEQHGAVGKG